MPDSVALVVGGCIGKSQADARTRVNMSPDLAATLQGSLLLGQSERHLPGAPSEPIRDPTHRKSLPLTHFGEMLPALSPKGAKGESPGATGHHTGSSTCVTHDTSGQAGDGEAGGRWWAGGSLCSMSPRERSLCPAPCTPRGLGRAGLTTCPHGQEEEQAVPRATGHREAPEGRSGCLDNMEERTPPVSAMKAAEQIPPTIGTEHESCDLLKGKNQNPG